ncbi:MAG: FkbM family methyltransferase [Candidatus Promineifilaceae bacterium]
MQTTIGLLRSLLIYYGNPLQTRRLRHLYSSLLVPGDLYFDLGAHVGNRVAAALSCGASVVALEPNPVLFSFLLHRYGRKPAVTLLQQAAGDHPGQATLFLSDATPTVSSLSAEWITAVSDQHTFSQVRWNKEITVETTTLDNLISQHGIPAFCKVDIEGSELAALNGLSTALPALSFEFLPGLPGDAAACVRYLESLDTYEYNWAAGEQFRLQSPVWLTAADILELLQEQLTSGKSGDIYARKITPLS